MPMTASPTTKTFHMSLPSPTGNINLVNGRGATQFEGIRNFQRPFTAPTTERRFEFEQKEYNPNMRNSVSANTNLSSVQPQIISRPVLAPIRSSTPSSASLIFGKLASPANNSFNLMRR